MAKIKERIETFFCLIIITFCYFIAIFSNKLYESFIQKTFNSLLNKLKNNIDNEEIKIVDSKDI